MILWVYRRICGPSLTETSLCGACLYFHFSSKLPQSYNARQYTDGQMNGYAMLLSAFYKKGRQARSDDRCNNYIAIPFCHRVAVA